jgi:hypothetical protein
MPTDERLSIVGGQDGCPHCWHPVELRAIQGRYHERAVCCYCDAYRVVAGTIASWAPATHGPFLPRNGPLIEADVGPEGQTAW